MVAGGFGMASLNGSDLFSDVIECMEMLCALDYHYLKKKHPWRDAAPVDFKLTGKKQVVAVI